MTASRPSPNFEIVQQEEPRKPGAPAHISHSQVEMYERCSWQYYNRYVLGLKEPPKLALEIGKGVHTALETNARTKIKTKLDMPVADLRDLTSDLIDAGLSMIPELEPGDNPGKAKDDGIAAVTKFRQDQAPKITPIIAEWEFNFDIAASEELDYPLRIVNGKVDIIEAVVQRSPNGRAFQTGAGIRDYKVTGRAKTQPDVDLSRQLDLYDAAFTHATGESPVEVGLRMFLPSTKTLPARAEQILRSKERMTPAYREARRARLAHTYQTTERAIKAAIFKPADDPRVCGWCGYRQQCQFSLVKNDYEAARAREAA